MSKLTGICRCTYCEKEFDWEYHIPTKISNIAEPIEFVFGIVHAERINSLSSDEIELCLECPGCSRPNFLTYIQTDVRS